VLAATIVAAFFLFLPKIVMRVSKLEVNSFRCFESFKLDFDENCMAHILLAPNGLGKTAFLKALACSLGSYVHFVLGSTDFSQSSPIQHSDVRTVWEIGDGFAVLSNPNYPCTVVCTALVRGRKVHWSRSLNKLTSNFNEKVANSEDLRMMIAELDVGGQEPHVLPIVAYYGTARFTSPRRLSHPTYESPPQELSRPYPSTTTEEHSADRKLGYLDSLNGSCDWPVLERWLFLETSFANQKGTRLTNCLEMAYRAVHLVLCLENEPYFDPRIGQMMLQLPNASTAVPHAILSDGYRTMLGLVLDIVRRVSMLNPSLRADALGNIDGVVMIDEIDMHLHPQWQRQVIRQLCAAFPKIQYVITTHSPCVVSGAAEIAEVFVFDHASDGSIVASRVEPSVFADSDAVLTSRLFKLETTADPRLLQLLQELSELNRRRDFLTPEENRRREFLSNNFIRSGRSAQSSSIELLVSDVTEKLLQRDGKELQRLSWDEVQRLRDEVFEVINSK
jgi:predicted ATP-binding protein involved in virulence